MAIDNAVKRRSSLSTGVPGMMPPIPDGDLDTAGDRAHMAGVYRFAGLPLNPVQGIIGMGFGAGVLSVRRRGRR